MSPALPHKERETERKLKRTASDSESYRMLSSPGDMQRQRAALFYIRNTSYSKL